MCNIAIVLGVALYEHAEDLPACKNDVDSMYQLLQATGKYRVLKVSQEITKSHLIEKIDDFNKSEDEQIDEILYYFSSHGYRDDEDLHYVLKNKEIEKINATSFNNKELDDLIRRYNPQLFVKIIDACKSGFNYIKSVKSDNNSDERNTLYVKNDKAFQSCIFMSSSKSNEMSITTDECSLFTKAFISSV